jgi:hypothetical protein
MNKDLLSEVKRDIELFSNMFKENPVKEINEGTWFQKLLLMVLNDHSKKVNAEYFKRKYRGLDNERIAYRLVDTSAKYTALAGGLIASAVTAAELSSVVSGGVGVAATAALIIGELSYISYQQLKLIYDISIVLDARLDKDDPEDMITIFWFALGINMWEDLGNVALKAGPRSAEYIGRKVLRSGFRSGLQNVAKRFGGQALAKKITERACLKLLVPGVNIPVAAIFNNKFTKSLGKRAIISMKKRGMVIRNIDILLKQKRIQSLLSVPLIFHIGIEDEPKSDNTDNIQMLRNVNRHININDEENQLIDRMINLDFDEFCDLFISTYDSQLSEVFIDIAIISSLLSESKSKYMILLRQFSDRIGYIDLEKRINKYKKIIK